MKEIGKKKIDVSWLVEVDENKLTRVLKEYELIQKRFVPWLCFVMANSNNEKVTQLLLPNLIEECGDYNKSNSHHELYIKMLNNNGVSLLNHKHSAITLLTDKLFTELFKSENTYKSLCVLGPGIEAISSDFIYPMYKAVLTHFGDSKHMIYFTLHLSEMEDEHAECIDTAIKILESNNPKLFKNKEQYIDEGITVFRNFWDGLKRL